MKFLRPFADWLPRRETRIGGSDGDAGGVLSLFGDRTPEPAADAWLGVEARPQLTEGDVRCSAFALCDGDGRGQSVFQYGETALFVYEFEFHTDVFFPVAGISISMGGQTVVYGRDTLQTGCDTARWFRRGERLRVSQSVQLRLKPQRYEVSVWLTACAEALFAARAKRQLSLAASRDLLEERCRVINVGFLEVGDAALHLARHHGLCDLRTGIRVTVREPDVKHPLLPPVLHAPEWEGKPTVFHVTHWKAGSQWIHTILRQVAGERIVDPQLGQAQFVSRPIRPGYVYPTVYATKEQFDAARLPAEWRRFVMIRDLRDTLISGFFSMAYSHGAVSLKLMEIREKLLSGELDDGLIYLMGEWLWWCAHIQLSWVEAGEPVIRYEDLLQNDVEILESVLIDQCALPVSRDRLRDAVLAARFDRLSGGRERGTEDRGAHWRKGIAGDWRNCFSERVKEVFKTRFGGVLIRTGYEKDLDW